MVYGLSKHFGALPYAGALMDQPVELLVMLAVLREGGVLEAASAPPSADPLAELPMMAL